VRLDAPFGLHEQAGGDQRVDQCRRGALRPSQQEGDDAERRQHAVVLGGNAQQAVPGAIKRIGQALHLGIVELVGVGAEPA
jgi:hypothetical protein